MSKFLFKCIGCVLIYTSVLSFSAFAVAEVSESESIFVYHQEVGGPYFDEWYLYGKENSDMPLSLHRGGKSGSLEIPIMVDCQSRQLSIVGESLLHVSDIILPNEAQTYLSQPVIDATLVVMCGE